MPRFPCALLRLLVIPLCVLAVLLSSSCRKASKGLAAPVKAQAISDLNYLSPRPIGKPATGIPWVGNLKAVDLDRDSLLDVVFCDSKESRLIWLRQKSAGSFEESELAANLSAPVSVEAVDLDGDGDLDLAVGSMGEVFPNNDKIGTLFLLENDGKQHFVRHVVLEQVCRITDVQAGDFNGDGQIDLAVGQFGYDQGEVRWLERTGPWTFRSHVILNLSGTINVCVADFNGDKIQDIAAIVSQEWEEIFLFTNKGSGRFESKVIWGSTNEDYNTSNMSLCDLNRDGRPDLLFSNGDGFGPSPVPGPRPWHGVQWLENKGAGSFKYHRIGDLAGAYSPIAVDLDQDGALDVVAVSAFNEWDKASAVSLVWFKNDGTQAFVPHLLAHEPIQLLTIAAGNFNGDGRPALVSGAFFAAPPYDRLSRLTLWSRAAP